MNQKNNDNKDYIYIYIYMYQSKLPDDMDGRVEVKVKDHQDHIVNKNHLNHTTTLASKSKVSS